MLSVEDLCLRPEEEERKGGDARAVVYVDLARGDLLVVTEPAGVEALQPAIERRRMDLQALLVLIKLHAALAAGGVDCLDHIREEARAQHRLQKLGVVGVTVGLGAGGVAFVVAQRPQIGEHAQI